MPWPLLAAACLAMFAAACSGTTRAPFLIDMARDLTTSLALVANLVAITSIAWGICSIVAGIGSDRWGRRPFLLGGPVGLAISLVGVANAQTFLGVAAWASAGGACAGAFTGVIMAEASARVIDRQRGRALGWVMAGQSLTLLVGVPLAAWLGSFIGWRGVNLCVAGVAIAAAAGLFVTTLKPVDGPRAAGTVRPSYRSVLSGRVVRLLAMGVLERICYGLAVFAIGSLLGTVLGGQLADRLPNRLHTFAGAMFASSCVAIPLFGWTPGLFGTVFLAFLYVLINAIARPSLMAALANVPSDVRGTVLGLNVTSASFGWLGAASLGGWAMAQFGFAMFGPLAACVGIAGGLLGLRMRR